jgi:hypothetical protein
VKLVTDRRKLGGKFYQVDGLRGQGDGTPPIDANNDINYLRHTSESGNDRVATIWLL